MHDEKSSGQRLLCVLPCDCQLHTYFLAEDASATLHATGCVFVFSVVFLGFQVYTEAFVLFLFCVTVVPFV